MIERGIIEQINARGRMTLRLADRLVVADLHSGSGGSIGDLLEGDMRPGLQSWRNVGNGVLSVVQVVAIQRAAVDVQGQAAGPGLRPDARAAQSMGRQADHVAGAEAGQNSKRRFS